MDSSLKEKYTTLYENTLKAIADSIEQDLKRQISQLNHIDRVTARAKTPDSFLKKAAKKLDDGEQKYDDPLNQIQDQIGARVIIFYTDDISKVKKKVLEYYSHIEDKTHIPDSEKEFGYVGEHLILKIPSEFVPMNLENDLLPKFFELQIKTLYQHAFSEASHDLAYKPDTQLSYEQKRMVAFTAAQSWGADKIFSDLLKQQN